MIRAGSRPHGSLLLLSSAATVSRFAPSSLSLPHQASDGLLEEFLGETHADAVVELGPYLRDAFGNATRIDYGSGAWLTAQSAVRAAADRRCVFRKETS